jgi:hypothetical protein
MVQLHKSDNVSRVEAVHLENERNCVGEKDNNGDENIVNLTAN